MSHQLSIHYQKHIEIHSFYGDIKCQSEQDTNYKRAKYKLLQKSELYWTLGAAKIPQFDKIYNNSPPYLIFDNLNLKSSSIQSQHFQFYK
jgi:hypothetical protein